MAFQTYNYLLDSGTQLKDAGLVAADAAGTVGGAAAYVDLGAANSYAEFDVVVDWTAMEHDTGDEVYELRVQGAEATTFATPYTLARTRIGIAALAFQPVDHNATGRVVLHCDNVACTSATDANSLIATRYIRIYCDVTGTIATGFNYTAYLVPKSS